MSDIHETIDVFEDIFKKKLGKKKHSYMWKVLLKQKDISITQPLEKMNMNLAGNNSLMTKERLTPADIEILYDALKSNTYVAVLDLRYNNLPDEAAQTVAKLMEESVALKELNLMCNEFTEEGAKAIAKALHKNESVTSLRMNGNKIGNTGGMYFAQALQINQTLQALDLGDTDQKIESVIALCTVLHQNTTLKALNINRPILFTHQEETTVHFGRLLKTNKTLKELHLMKYDMRDFGATRLAENLMDNFTLTYLNLSCNRITRDGAKELANLLKLNTPLQVLDLGFNRLEDDGACHLAEAVATYNTSLITLVVTSNNIKGKGLCALADSMKMNSTLEQVYIWGNHLEESACIAFANLIDLGRLESKNTDVEPYVVDGKTSLAELSNGIRTWYYWGPSYGPHIDAPLSLPSA